MVKSGKRRVIFWSRAEEKGSVFWLVIAKVLESREFWGIGYFSRQILGCWVGELGDAKGIKENQ